MDKREWQEATGQRRPGNRATAAQTAGSRGVARILDDLVRIPGTNITLGADALLGLVPGVGDAATTAMAGIILVDAIVGERKSPHFIDTGKCIKCGTCVEKCKFKAISTR